MCTVGENLKSDIRNEIYYNNLPVGVRPRIETIKRTERRGSESNSKFMYFPDAQKSPRTAANHSKLSTFGRKYD